MSFATKCRAFVAALILLSTAVAGPGTPTEREAARDVLAKMAALEASLDVPALVAKLTGPNADRDQVAARAKALMNKGLLALADDIATHPEIGFEEKRSVGKLIEYLQKHDFSVETGSAGVSPGLVPQ